MHYKEVVKALEDMPPRLSYGKDTKDINEYMDRDDERSLILKRLDKQAQEDGTLVGRVLWLSVADGRVPYVVVRAYKKTVTLQWVSHVDSYRDLLLGDGGDFPRDRIEPLLNAQAHLDRLFGE